MASMAGVRGLSRAELAGMRYCRLRQPVATPVELRWVILRGWRSLHLHRCGGSNAQDTLQQPLRLVYVFQ